MHFVCSASLMPTEQIHRQVMSERHFPFHYFEPRLHEDEKNNNTIINNTIHDSTPTYDSILRNSYLRVCQNYISLHWFSAEFVILLLTTKFGDGFCNDNNCSCGGGTRGTQWKQYSIDNIKTFGSND